jgi:hypothetical protein
MVDMYVLRVCHQRTIASVRERPHRRRRRRRSAREQRSSLVFSRPLESRISSVRVENGYDDSAAKTSTKFDFIVIGNGPIGAAVAYEISRRFDGCNESVLVLDSSESLSSGSNDLGRIVRPLDAEGREDFTELNQKSIERFPGIEREANVVFFEKRGSLSVGSEAFVRKPRELLEAKGIEHEVFKGNRAIASRFSYLSENEVPSEYVAVSDAVGGYVNPHKMRSAFNFLMKAKNPEKNFVRRQTCEEIISLVDDGNEMVKVITTCGNVYFGTKVVVAAGYYTQPLLVRSGFDLESLEDVQISKRTVVFAKVKEEDLELFREMPTIKYELPKNVRASSYSNRKNSNNSDQSKNEAKSVYILPPIFYPGPVPKEGYYIKIGGGPNDFMTLSKAVLQNQTAEKTPSPIEMRKELDAIWPEHRKSTYHDQQDDIETWMQGDGDLEMVPQLQKALAHVFPDVCFESIETKACATTCTSNGSIRIEKFANDSIVCVTGCNGKAAGPALAISSLVADALCIK